MNPTNKRSIDVILFNPAPRSGWQPHRRVELPLNLLTPATPLIHADYNVCIIDQFADLNWRKKLYASLENKPLCFGISSMTGPQVLRAIEACKLFKSLHPDVPTVWGGIHGSMLPEQTLANPYVDIVVVGEGEDTLLDLVKTLEDGGSLDDVSGIAYIKEGQYRFTGQRPFVDLNKQPPLAYHLLNVDLYRRRIFGADHVSFNSSRGCASRCAFCWESAINKRRWRAMEPEVVLDQLKRFVSEYDIHGFLFTDDNFFQDLNRAHEILEEIVKSNLNISLGKLQVRADTVCSMEKDFFKLMVKAGVKRLNIGVESGSQRVLDFLKKGETVEQAIGANRKVASYPIVPLYLFMMGLPTETPEELAQSIDLATRLTEENPRAVKTFNIYTPYPGTELYETCIQLGLKPPRSLEGWSQYNYRNIPEDAMWLDSEMKTLIETLDFPLMFLGKGQFVTPYRKTNPVVVGLSKLYYSLARYRVKHLYTRFPIETRLVKALGLFGKQN